jgi:hypothetical protein
VCVPFIINQTPAAGGDHCHGPHEVDGVLTGSTGSLKKSVFSRRPLLLEKD